MGSVSVLHHRLAMQMKVCLGISRRGISRSGPLPRCYLDMAAPDSSRTSRELKGSSIFRKPPSLMPRANSICLTINLRKTLTLSLSRHQTTSLPPAWYYPIQQCHQTASSLQCKGSRQRQRTLPQERQSRVNSLLRLSSERIRMDPSHRYTSCGKEWLPPAFEVTLTYL